MLFLKERGKGTPVFYPPPSPSFVSDKELVSVKPKDHIV
jgi:hypothetical protein